MGLFESFRQQGNKSFADDELIEQSCAIPYRVSEGRLEFCLITSIRNGRWGFPKGIIDPGETAEQTALKEAHEEAGLAGRICGPPLGAYLYKKWGRDLRVTVYLMEIARVDARWDEARVRQRRFCDREEADSLLAKSPQRKFFQLALAGPLRSP